MGGKTQNGFAPFVLLVLLLILFRAIPELYEHPLPHVPRKALIRHFSVSRLSDKELATLSAFQELPSVDSLRRHWIIEKHKPLRAALMKLVNQRLLYTLIDPAEPQDLPQDLVPQIARALANFKQEPVHQRRLAFLSALAPEERWQTLAGEFFLFRADTLLEADNYADARESFLHALRYFQSLGDDSRAATAAFWIGYVDYLTDRYSDSLPMLQYALQVAQKTGHAYREQRCLHRIGVVYKELREYDAAERFLHEAAEKARALHDRYNEARARSTLATTFEASGMVFLAQEMLNESLKIYEDRNAAYDEGLTHRRLGFTYENLGQYQRAQEHHEISLDIFRRIGRPLGQIDQLINLGHLFGGMGNYPRALDYFESALAIAQGHDIPLQIAICHANFGAVLTRMGQFESAFEHLELALDYTSDKDHRARRAEFYQAIGEARLTQGELSKAAAAFLRAMKINKEHDFDLGLINNHLGLARIFLERADLEKARDHFEQALEMALTGNYYSFIRRSYYGLGLVHNRAGRHKTALRNFLAAIDIIEVERSRIRELESRVEYFASRQEVYNAACLTYLVHLNDKRRALQLAEQAKARAFLDLIQGGVTVQEPQQPRRRSLAVIPSEALQIPSVEAIQKLLSREDLLIEYRVLDEQVLIWCVERHSVETYRVHVPKDSLRNLVGRYRALSGADSSELRDRLGGAQAQSEFEAVMQVARRLSNILLKAVWPAARAKNQIYFIPDDLLHYVPFAALSQPSDSSRFLIEAFPMATAASASVLYHALSQEKAPLRRAPAALVVADPFGDLAATRAMSASILAKYPGSKLLLGRSAVKDSVRAALQTGRELLHFGTHISLNEESPLYSTIHLAEAAADARAAATAFEEPSPNLRTFEVFNLDLRMTRLVVLSGCESGLGRLVKGEGLVGLPRAFMHAGTPSLVTTLWKISEDATSRLMTRFYATLDLARTNYAAALRQAQLETIKEMRRDEFYQYPHPFFWAAFIAVGKSY